MRSGLCFSIPASFVTIFLALPAAAELKNVFAHYMVGTITSDHAVTDVKQAKALGIDAFALNLQNAQDDWATSAVSDLFKAANDNDFKLFFSLDMAVQSDVSYFLPILEQYHNNSAYYTHNDLPFVSTFYGATLNFGSDTPTDGWQKQLRDALSFDIYFIPGFSDAPNGPNDFFSTYPVVDGVFSWDSAWPYEQDGKANVTDSADKEYLSGAQQANKAFMMSISAVQFKHLSGQNWYRRGEIDLALRIPQILNDSPDFVEIITWNDGGESHNIGTTWPESIAGSDIPAYTDGYDHSGWQTLVPPLISAYKDGRTDLASLTPSNGTASGTFWYRPFLSTGDCSSDSLGQPSNADSAEDLVNTAVLLADDGYALTVSSGGNQIASYELSKGFNYFATPGLVEGSVKVEVSKGSGDASVSASSSQDVVSRMDVCNYNYQTVTISG